jgi:hypothetical protein
MRSTSQQPVVHEDAGELVADRAVHERCRHRRVDAAGQPAHGAGPAHLLPDVADRAVDEGVHGPRGVTAADSVDEVREHLAAALGVNDLGMELQPPDRALGVAHGREGRALAGRENCEVGRQPQHAIAVAHPHHVLRTARQVRQQRVVALDLEQSPPVLAVVGRLHHTAQPVGEQLQAVTDAQHRLAQVEQGRVEARRVGIEHAGGSAREHDARRVPGAHGVQVEVAGLDLAVDVLLANAARDQLRVLGAVVENEDAVALELAGLGIGEHGLSGILVVGRPGGRPAVAVGGKRNSTRSGSSGLPS